MERFIQLNLRKDTEKGVPANLPETAGKVPEPHQSSKRLNRLLKKAAHKAAAEFGQNRTGIFSK